MSMLDKKSKKINDENTEEFLNEVSKRIVLFMVKKNMPITSIFTENLISFVPRCDPLFEIVNWEIDETDENGIKWYSSISNFLLYKDERGTLPGNRLKFTYDAVKFKILKYHILYNITWRT